MPGRCRHIAHRCEITRRDGCACIEPDAIVSYCSGSAADGLDHIQDRCAGVLSDLLGSDRSCDASRLDAGCCRPRGRHAWLKSGYRLTFSPGGRTGCAGRPHAAKRPDDRYDVTRTGIRPVRRERCYPASGRDDGRYRAWAARGGGASPGNAGKVRAGSVITKRAPPSGESSSRTSPPCTSATRRTIARPRPNPPV